jgi:hypothetical protein
MNPPLKRIPTTARNLPIYKYLDRKHLADFNYLPRLFSVMDSPAPERS